MMMVTVMIMMVVKKMGDHDDDNDDDPTNPRQRPGVGRSGPGHRWPGRGGRHHCPLYAPAGRGLVHLLVGSVVHLLVGCNPIYTISHGQIIITNNAKAPQ